MIATSAELGVETFRRDGHPGCWSRASRTAAGPQEDRRARPANRTGRELPRIALNIDVDLRDFDIIDPCGMPGLVSTSIAEELGRTAEPLDRGGRACRQALRDRVRHGDRRAARLGRGRSLHG